MSSPNKSRSGLLRTTGHLLTTAVLASGLLALLITIITISTISTKEKNARTIDDRAKDERTTTT